jgi:hypothetical protein
MVGSEPKTDKEYSPLAGRIRRINPKRLAAQATNEAEPIALARKRPNRNTRKEKYRRLN